MNAGFAKVQMLAILSEQRASLPGLRSAAKGRQDSLLSPAEGQARGHVGQRTEEGKAAPGVEREAQAHVRRTGNGDLGDPGSAIATALTPTARHAAVQIMGSVHHLSRARACEAADSCIGALLGMLVSTNRPLGERSRLQLCARPPQTADTRSPTKF